MDFITYSGKTENGLIDGDLMLDPATDDLRVDESDIGPVMAAIRELFEMPPADDLSHPEYYSRQRSFQGSEGSTAELERIQDARRLLKLIPEINQNSVDIAIVDGLLDVQFNLVSGQEGRIRL